MGRYGTTGWPRGLCSASPGVDQCDALPPCVSPFCSSSPRQTPLRPSRPRSRSPAGHLGPNCSAAAAATTTSTKAEQASPTCCERRSTSSTATPRPQPKRCPEGLPDGRRAAWAIMWQLSSGGPETSAWGQKHHGLFVGYRVKRPHGGDRSASEALSLARLFIEEHFPDPGVGRSTCWA